MNNDKTRRPSSSAKLYLFSDVIAVVLFAFLAGCATTTVSNATPMVEGNVQKPKTIWVYPFIADPAEIPADASIKASLSEPSNPPTAEQLETGKKLGQLIAQKLVDDINAMGMNAALGGPGVQPQVGDGILRGYLVSTNSGSMAGRFVIGFGAGASELDTVVEGYAVTPTGLRKMGSGEINAGGNKMPGLVAPAAIAIATGNPIGLAVMGGAKVIGEASGRTGLDGRAKATADKIAAQLKERFTARGWIST
jgi:Domain of unknown function (DUF4410)